MMSDPVFAKFVKLLKMKVPLLSLRNQIRAAGAYDPDDILYFASKGEINALKANGDYKGDKFPLP